MKKFYTVDRNNSLNEGLTINLNEASKKFPYSCYIDGCKQDFYMQGLSKHGDRYYKTHNTISGQYEFDLECIRRVLFSDKPSRLQSMFAWGTLADAIRFIHQDKYLPITGIFRIYEIECEHYHRADMSFCDPKYSHLKDSRFKQYWAGDFDFHPESNNQFEYLLPLPVTVGKVTLVYHKFQFTI